MSSTHWKSWQLGHIDEIPMQALSDDAGDTNLDVVLDGADTSRVIVGLLDRVPTRRWRLVRDTRPEGRATRREVWCAPADTDTWWVLTASHLDGVRHIQIDPEPRTPVPSRGDRRSSLELDWASTEVGVTESALMQHEFEFALRNIGKDDWHNIAGDSRSITIVASAEMRFYVDVGDHRQLPTLIAGDSIPIYGRLSERLSAGTYELRAYLADLNLATLSFATLTVVAG
jgi:hypothetical protein